VSLEKVRCVGGKAGGVTIFDDTVLKIINNACCVTHHIWSDDTLKSYLRDNRNKASKDRYGRGFKDIVAALKFAGIISRITPLKSVAERYGDDGAVWIKTDYQNITEIYRGSSTDIWFISHDDLTYFLPILSDSASNLNCIRIVHYTVIRAESSRGKSVFRCFKPKMSARKLKEFIRYLTDYEIQTNAREVFPILITNDVSLCSAVNKEFSGKIMKPFEGIAETKDWGSNDPYIRRSLSNNTYINMLENIFEGMSTTKIAELYSITEQQVEHLVKSNGWIKSIIRTQQYR
jgi:hypothetical protein